MIHLAGNLAISPSALGIAIQMLDEHDELMMSIPVQYKDLDELIIVLTAIRNAHERKISLKKGLWAQQMDGKISSYGTIGLDFDDGYVTYTILARPMDNSKKGIGDVIYMTKDTLEKFPVPYKK